MTIAHPLITDTLPTAILSAAVSLVTRDEDREHTAQLDILTARTDRSERIERAAARRYAAGRTADRARRAHLPATEIPVIACDDAGPGYLMRGMRWSTYPAATVVLIDGPCTLARRKLVYPW